MPPISLDEVSPPVATPVVGPVARVGKYFPFVKTFSLAWPSSAHRGASFARRLTEGTALLVLQVIDRLANKAELARRGFLEVRCRFPLTLEREMLLNRGCKLHLQFRQKLCKLPLPRNQGFPLSAR